MKDVRRPVAVLVLLLAVLFGLGLDSRHAQHELEHAYGAPARFEAGHDTPIHEEHVESARLLHEDSCLACALLSSTTSFENRAARHRVPLLAGQTALESAHADRQFQLSPLLGRAPPSI